MVRPIGNKPVPPTTHPPRKEAAALEKLKKKTLEAVRKVPTSPTMSSKRHHYSKMEADPRVAGQFFKSKWI